MEGLSPRACHQPCKVVLNNKALCLDLFQWNSDKLKEAGKVRRLVLLAEPVEAIEMMESDERGY